MFSHILGTIALISILLSLTLVFAWIQDFNKINTIKIKLGEITNYVASEIISVSALSNLGEISGTNNYYYVKLDIPKTIEGYAYNLTIIKQNGKYYLKAYLTLKTWVSTQTELSFSEGGYIEPLYSGKGEIDNTGIFYSSEIQSSVVEPLIICFNCTLANPSNSNLCISLGYRG